MSSNKILRHGSVIEDPNKEKGRRETLKGNTVVLRRREPRT